MYSDNGSNFHGLWNLIEKTRIESRMKIKWVFNPPTAPWWGRVLGAFDRNNEKSVKVDIRTSSFE